MTRATKKPASRLRLAAVEGTPAVCGLCGAGGALKRTACCGNPICGEAEDHPGDPGRSGCHRNHAHQTLCAWHHAEGHAGDWKDCTLCRQNFLPEMYAWYATNEYNFDKLETPPKFEPTLCDRCRKRIVLPEGGYTTAGGR